MKLDITPILRNPGAEVSFSLDESLEMLAEGIAMVSFTGLVHLEGALRNDNGMMELKAVASVPYQTVCRRCCEPITDILSVSIREDVVGKDEWEPESAEEEPEERYMYSGHELGLDIIASEALLLEAPVYILCREDCKGLCEECGANLNQKDCDCGLVRPLDLRLEALHRFTDPKEN
jgi:uncharacterized protein